MDLAVHLLADVSELPLQPFVDVPGAHGLRVEEQACLFNELRELPPLVGLFLHEEDDVGEGRHILQQLLQALLLRVFPALLLGTLLLAWPIGLLAGIRRLKERRIPDDHDMLL